MFPKNFDVADWACNRAISVVRMTISVGDAYHIISHVLPSATSHVAWAGRIDSPPKGTVEAQVGVGVVLHACA